MMELLAMNSCRPQKARKAPLSGIGEEREWWDFDSNSGIFYPKQGGLDPNKISGVGTNLGILVHVLPGPTKQHALKPSIFLAELGGKIISPVTSFVLGIPFINSYVCDSRCPFGQIDNRKQILRRFRSHFQKM
jgi:hypothetical protein